jgi:hypothetical protein
MFASEIASASENNKPDKTFFQREKHCCPSRGRQIRLIQHSRFTFLADQLLKTF